MEAKNMANQERGIRRGIFVRTNVPTRETTIPVLPKPEVAPSSTPPQSEKPQKTKKPLIQRLVQNLTVRLGLVTLALGGSGYAAYQEIPAVHRTVDNLFGRVSTEDVPNTFDNNLDKGVIGDNNIVRMTRKEIQKLPKFDKNGKILRTFPVALTAGEQVQYQKEFSGGMVHPGIDVDPLTTKNVIKFTISAGKPIIASANGYLFEGFGGGLVLISLDRNGKPSSQLYDLNSVDAFQMIVDAPKLSEDNNNGKEWGKGLPVLNGEEIALTTKDIAFRGTLIESTGQTFYDPKVEGNWNFKTESSKLVTSQG